MLNDYFQRDPKKRTGKQFRGSLRRRIITGNLRSLSQRPASQMTKIATMIKNIVTLVQRLATKRRFLRTPAKGLRTMKTHQKVQRKYTTKHPKKFAKKGLRNNMKSMKKAMRRTTKKIPKIITPQNRFYLRFQMSHKRLPTALMLLAPTLQNKTIMMFLPRTLLLPIWRIM